MARAVSTQAASLIADGNFDRVWVADLMYDGDRRLANVGLESPRLSWDGSQQIVGSGSVRVVWSDDHASSMVPKQVGDWFSPFGAELQIDCIIGAGVFAERVPMGRFVVESVPDTVEAELLWNGRLIHPGESFGVNLRDPFIRVVRNRFTFPTRAVATSAWDEIQNITGLPVIRNVDDVSIPEAVTHDEDRAKAVADIFDRLGAWPMVDSAGVLTARPKAWPGSVGSLDGGVVEAPRSLTSEFTYNRVAVEGKSDDGNPVYGSAEVTDGYLRVANSDGTPSPFGVSTYRYQSNYLSSKPQCDAYALELLERVSKIRNVTRRVVERFNPLREVGDVLEFQGGVVRVQKVTHTDAVTELTVEVPDE